MRKQKLPIGIQSFQKLREDDGLYIDKTQYIHQLIEQGDYYFLSRPRRFGKSLTISTISALFQGQKELFKGLWIENNWNWAEKHPVIHLSFSLLDYQGQGITKALLEQLAGKALEYNIILEKDTIKTRFQEFIKKLSKQGKIVLLIDEYDKPLIDYLSKETRQQATENQKVLKSFYSVIKDSDAYIKFLLITGVSKFSKVGIFSDLNNLQDITLNRDFAALTGYTQAELDHYFQPYRPKAIAYNELSEEELSIKIKEWYNGYSWDGQTFVYNPWSILCFFSEGVFRNFWFATGTPSFLIELMKERLEYNIEAGEPMIESFLDSYPLLFQIGYLTIKSFDKSMGLYRLGYANKEVKNSLLWKQVSA